MQMNAFKNPFPCVYVLIVNNIPSNLTISFRTSHLIEINYR